MLRVEGAQVGDLTGNAERTHLIGELALRAREDDGLVARWIERTERQQEGAFSAAEERRPREVKNASRHVRQAGHSRSASTRRWGRCARTGPTRASAPSPAREKPPVDSRARGAPCPCSLQHESDRR